MKLCYAILFSFIFACHFLTAAPVELIYNSQFENLRYNPREDKYNLQPNWLLSPRNDYSGYRVVFDVEGTRSGGYLNVKYDRVPRGGWKQLQTVVTFLSAPRSETVVRFRARGDGEIRARVYEYCNEINPKKSRNQTLYRQKFLGCAAELTHIRPSRSWKDYQFIYRPKHPQAGMVKIIFYYTPVSGDKINLDIAGLSAKAEPVSRSGVPARLVIPELKTKPGIDGTIHREEWKGALELSGFKSIFSSKPEPKGVSRAWLGYDEEYLYLAFDAASGEPPVRRTIGEKRDLPIYRDDSLEMIFHSEKGTKYIHMIVNGQNLIYDARQGESSSRWNPEWKHAVTSHEKGWRAEIAIPRKLLPGRERFKLNIMHNDLIRSSQCQQMTNYIWSLSKAPGTEKLNFCTPDYMPLAELGKSSCGIRVGEDSLEAVLVNNTLQQSVFSVEYGNEDTVAGSLFFQIPANSSAVYPLEYSPVNQFGIVVVRDEKGNVIYRNAEVYRHRLESMIGLKKYFPCHFIELTSTIQRPEKYELHWKLAEKKGVFHVNAAGKTPLRISLAGIPAGKTHLLSIHIKDASGNVLGQKDFPLEIPGREPWENCKLGYSDKPLPPFTEIACSGDSLKFLMSQYVYGARALPQRLLSENIDLLAAPVTLKLNGFDISGCSREVTSRKPNRVEWSAEDKAGPIHVSWKCWAEEDGFAWYEFTISSRQPEMVRRLELNIPLKNEFAELLNPMPFLKSGGDMDGRYKYDHKPWQSLEHKQIISLFNEFRGIEMTSLSERNWSNLKAGCNQRIVPGKDCATLQMTFADRPFSLRKPLTYSFGIQAFPTKKIRVTPRDLNESNCIDPRTAVYSGGGQKAVISYRRVPIQASGTLELLADFCFDPAYLYPDPAMRSYLKQHIAALGKVSLLWDNEHGGLALRAGDKIYGTKSPKLKPGSRHHIALSWNEKGFKLYLDGRLLADGKEKILRKEVLGVELGKSYFRHHSDFNYHMLRISGRELSPEAFRFDGNLNPSEEAVLAEDFRSGTGKGTVTGDVRRVKTDRGEVLSTYPGYFSQLDYLQAAGARSFIGYLLMIFGKEFLGEPYADPQTLKSYSIFVNELRKRNMEVYFGTSFGIGFGTREDQLYGDYWYKTPIYRWGSETRGFNTYCINVQFLQDFLIYHLNRRLNENPSLNLYTDNLFLAGQKCRNFVHGCGYIDENGQECETGNLLRGREFAKRFYAITKLRSDPRRHYLHSSGCNHAIFLSWADSYHCGEQYLENADSVGWNIDLNQYRAQNVAAPYGIPSNSISELVPFGMHGMLAVAALHNCGAVPLVWRNFPEKIDEASPAWKALARFDITDAEFVPYWRNQQFVKLDHTKRYFASFYRKNGQCLFVVSNLTWDKADIPVQINFAALGLRGIVQDINTGETIEVKNGGILLKIPFYQARFLLVK